MKGYCFRLVLVICLSGLLLTKEVRAQQQGANPERNSAIQLLKERKFDSAVKAFRTYLSNSSNQNDSDAWIYFGIALHRNHELNAAKDALKKAIKLNPKSDSAQSSYASVLYDLHKPKDAEKAVNESLKYNPKNVEALYIRGVLQFDKNDFGKALSDAATVLQIAPDFAPVYLLKAQIIVCEQFAKNSRDPNLGDFPDSWKWNFLTAAQLIEKYLQSNPTDKDADSLREQMNAFRFYSGNESSFRCEKSTATSHPDVYYRVKASYTELARSNGVRGIIRLKALFDADGQIKYIMPLNYLGGGLTNEAIKALRKFRFKPMFKDGKPVCTTLVVEFAFNLL